MKILSIGNSFSQDAQRYLHQIARADGVNIEAVNLYIPGCLLSHHYRNMLSEEEAYKIEINGMHSGFDVSMKEALLNRDWDVVTIQQGSLKSACYEAYQPYLNKIVEYIRLCAPQAKVAIHQTWAYEKDSKMLTEWVGYTDHIKMFEDIKEAYQKAFEDSKADILLPSGELMQKMLASGIEKVHRDGFHLGLGRYAVGLLWYSMLTGNDIMNNTFSDFYEEVSEEEIKITKKCVSEMCNN